jgi:hypothetical protein
MTWHELEEIRRDHEWRTLHVRLGDIFADLAWLHLHRTPSHCRHRKACGLLVKAVDQYQLAGLGRRAESAWRYARLVHRIMGRAA